MLLLHFYATKKAVKTTRPVSKRQILLSVLLCSWVALACAWLFQQGSPPGQDAAQASDPTVQETQSRSSDEAQSLETGHTPSPAAERAQPTPGESVTSNNTLLEDALKSLQDGEIQLPQQLRRHGEIAAADVNIRALPQLQSEILAQPKKGQRYVFTGREAQADELDWVELELPQRTAWVARQFVVWEDPSLSSADSTARNASEAQGASDTQALASNATPHSASAEQALHLQGIPSWRSADEKQQLSTAYALLRGVFKTQPRRVTPENLTALLTCMQASAREPHLQKLKVYELAAACALALEWR